ncbi:MAG: DNA adenine methylase [Thermoguttaceae bacterium]|nr:DNA adenine methylase [Thermoguttaceae bacterium]MBQ5788929.1 DNA adenine methylase [Thermoguttaceae bacterium]
MKDKNATPLKTPFSWRGSKVRMLGKIVPILEDARRGRRVYVEPFGGTGSVLLALTPFEREVYNDADERLVDFFRALADDESRAKLRRWGETFPQSRAIFDEMKRDWIRSPELAKRAFALFYVQAFSFGGKPFDAFGFVRKIYTNHDRDLPALYRRRVASFDAFAERFRLVNVERLDWREVVDKYDSEQAFFYCDPPYLAPGSACYVADARPVDWRELIDRLLTLKGGAALSCYDCDECAALREAGWTRYDFKASQSTAHSSRNANRARVETLYVKGETV